MKKLVETRRIIESALSAANAAMLFSGGMDSLLTLFLVREQADIPVITFAADWEAEHWKRIESLAAKWNLTLYTFPASNRYFIPHGEELALVDEYKIGDLTLPVIRDIERGEKCISELDTRRHQGFSLGWNTLFTGVLESDAGVLFDNPLAKHSIFEQGGIRFISPLRDWTKKEVESQIKAFGLIDLVISGTGEIKRCAKCLTETSAFYCEIEDREIEPLKWQPEEMLAAFEAKYNGV